MNSGKANFLFCVGAQKAGTTWLYNYFASHPQVHVQSVKEIHYFNVLWDAKQIGFRRQRENHLATYPVQQKGVLAAVIGGFRETRTALAMERGDGGLYEDTRRLVDMHASTEPDHAAYRRLMLDGSGRAPWVADITPDYSVLGAARFKEMAESFPDSKFLYLMRDPIQRTWSHIKMRTRWIRENARPEMTEDGVINKMIAGQERHILDRSNYRGTLLALRQLPADRVKHMFFETMFDDAQIRELCDYMAIAFQPGDYSRRVREGAELDMTPRQFRTLAWLTAPSYRMVRRQFRGQLPETWNWRAANAGVPKFIDPDQIHPSVLKRLV